MCQSSPPAPGRFSPAPSMVQGSPGSAAQCGRKAAGRNVGKRSFLGLAVSQSCIFSLLTALTRVSSCPKHLWRKESVKLTKFFLGSGHGQGVKQAPGGCLYPSLTFQPLLLYSSHLKSSPMSMQTSWVTPPGNGTADGELGEGCKINVSCLPHGTANSSPSKAAVPFFYFPGCLCYFCVMLLVKNTPCQHEQSYLEHPSLSLFGKSTNHHQLLPSS